MRLEPLIARRISGRTAIPAAAIAVGMVVMLLSIAIVRGFQQEVSGKVSGFVGDVRVVSLTQDPHRVVYPVILDDSLSSLLESTPGVAHIQPFVVKAGMLKTEEDFLATQFMGVGADYDTTFLCRYLVDGRMPRSETTESPELLLSQYIARTLRLHVGDKVFAYFFTEKRLRARRMRVVGIYQTHLSDYDQVMCFTDIATVRQLHGWRSDQVSGLDLRLQEGLDRRAFAEDLHARVYALADSIGAHRGAFSVEQLVPHTFAWLDVLDANVAMILVLMVLIASFTIVSGLLVVMLERVGLIGLLSALGASRSQLRGIFRRFGLRLVGRAMLIGDVVAMGLAYVQMRWHVVALDAETYYLDAVPISWSWPLFVIVNVGVLLVGGLVVYGTSFLVRRGSPAQALRWE